MLAPPYRGLAQLLAGRLITMPTPVESLQQPLSIYERFAPGGGAMIDLARIADLCQRLGLRTMATHLPHVADEAARNELSFIEFFERLLQSEHRERQERSRTLLMRTAGFPAIKTLEQYDFAFATGAPKPLLTELATLTFIERAENVVLLGPSGVGKTHIAVALGYKAHNPASRRGSFPPPT